MCSKKFFMFSVVLALALAQVFAWPTKVAKETIAPVEVVETTVVEETSQKPLSEMPNDVLNKFSETSANLDNKVVVIGDDLKTLKGDMADLTDAVVMLIADNRALQQELENERSALAKERGSKWFADIGASFGFKGNDLVYGLVGDVGYRLKSSLMLKLGTQMTVGTLTDVKKLVDLDINKERFVLTATVGWEW